MLVILGARVADFAFKKGPLINPQLQKQTQVKEIKPSETLTEYSDPSGFNFSYPDNLSIVKNETEDPKTFADISLASKDISGSLNLKIIETKLTSLEAWLKSNNISSSSATPKDLGILKAMEVKTGDRVMLVSLDQGVLFTIEMPRIEEDFWNKIYNKVLTNFSFALPEAVNGQSNSVTNDVSFESEEVVE